MPRPTSKDFQPEVLQLFDRYVHGDISRRSFLDRAATLVGSGASAAGLLTALNPQFAQAQQVAPDDVRLQTRYQVFDSPQGNATVRGYLAKPAGTKGKLPAVLVIHENRGLNPHIEDITRRLALDGFLVFAPDALASLGGYPRDEDRARELFSKLDEVKTTHDFLAAARALLIFPECTGKLGAVGFCYGGGVVNVLATEVPELAAAVAFYGTAPAVQDVPKIKARMLLHFAGADDRINAGWPKYEAALKTAAVQYQAFIYAGVQHGFNNDTTPRFDAAAAKLAWQRTTTFFKTNLA
jgi:carboxymethylenebutenolidase